MNPELRSILLGFFIGLSVMALFAIVAMLIKDSVIDVKVRDGIRSGLSGYGIQVDNN